MNTKHPGHDGTHHVGESATHPIAPRWTRHAALLVLAHRSAPRPRALPGTPIGARRATQLASRTVLSVETIRRMVAYFDRHEIDLEAPAARPGGLGYPSAGRIAWLLWGGDSGRAWARRILRAYQATRKE